MFERDSSMYRRGLTLGLTVAEIFILILFVLLLVLLALYALNVKTKNELDQTKNELSQTKNELRIKTNEFKEMQISFPKEIERLKLNIDSLEQTVADVNKENTIIKELLNQTEDKFPKDIQILTLDLASANVENAELTEELENILQTNNQLRDELYARKGIDPPCWYQVQHQQGKRKETPYYLLDIAVHDEHLRLKLRDAPPGRAIDEYEESALTSYAEEHAKLPLAPLSTSNNISLQEFVEMTEPIKNMGKNKEIRNYSCVFYVSVWDLTSATAKERWKKAEDAIKYSFYTYRVREDPWRYDDVAD